MQHQAERHGGIGFEADQLDLAIVRNVLLVQVGPRREPAAEEPKYLETGVVRSVGRLRVVVRVGPFDRRELRYGDRRADPACPALSLPRALRSGPPV